MKDLEIEKHNFVPKHILLTEKQKEEFFKKFKVSIIDLPRILSSDPVVKSIGAKAGDVIKIIRKSQTAGEVTYYRVVVKR